MTVPAGRAGLESASRLVVPWLWADEGADFASRFTHTATGRHSSGGWWPVSYASFSFHSQADVSLLWSDGRGAAASLVYRMPPRWSFHAAALAIPCRRVGHRTVLRFSPHPVPPSWRCAFPLPFLCLAWQTTARCGGGGRWRVGQGGERLDVCRCANLCPFPPISVPLVRAVR